MNDTGIVGASRLKLSTVRVGFKVDEGIQRHPIDRDPFGYRRCRGRGKRRIRFTPWPHSKSSRITTVFGVVLRQLSLSPNVDHRPQRDLSAPEPTIESLCANSNILLEEKRFPSSLLPRRFWLL